MELTRQEFQQGVRPGGIRLNWFWHVITKYQSYCLELIQN